MKERYSSFFAALSALALFGIVALAGCSATDLAGPATGPPETQQVSDAPEHRPAPIDAAHNNDTDGGTGTETGAKHNVMPSQD